MIGLTMDHFSLDQAVWVIAVHSELRVCGACNGKRKLHDGKNSWQCPACGQDSGNGSLEQPGMIPTGKLLYAIHSGLIIGWTFSSLFGAEDTGQIQIEYENAEIQGITKPWGGVSLFRCDRVFASEFVATAALTIINRENK